MIALNGVPTVVWPVTEWPTAWKATSQMKTDVSSLLSKYIATRVSEPGYFAILSEPEPEPSLWPGSGSSLKIIIFIKKKKNLN